MTSRTEESASSGLTRRWHVFLDGLGSPARDLPVKGGRRVPERSGRRDHHVHLGEVFVRADPEFRRSLDLLGVAVLERASEGYEQGHLPEAVVLSTETVRSHTTAARSGLLATNLPLGRGGAELRSVALVLFAVERRPYILDTIDSLESLGQVLDYENDVEGSMAVAEAIVRRVDSLAATAGVRVVVAGQVNRFARLSDENHHLLVPAEVDPGELGDLRIDDDGQVVADPPGGSAAPWRERDFVLMNFGRPHTDRGQFRSLRELRQAHALADIGLEPGTVSDQESWTARAARMRQTARAQQIMRRAAAGEADAAWELFRSAADQPDPGALIDALAAHVGTPRDYWLIDATLAPHSGEGTAGESDTPARTRARLLGELEQWLGLPAPASDDPMYMPITTAVVVEVGAGLAELVQSKPDGRDLFEEVIPEMREGIRVSTGVAIPGIRVRRNENFGHGQFQVQVDEVPVVDGEVSVDAVYRVRPYEGRAGGGAGELTNIDPRTGTSGVWLLVANDEAVRDVDDGGDGQDGVLTSTGYLIHRIEVALRARLPRFIGPQEVDTLLDGWRASDDDRLVVETVPDRRAHLRLTWLLQSLVQESVGVTDWRTILTAVKAAGGLNQPTAALVREVRLALRDRLPGPRDARWRVIVPPDLEGALAADDWSEFPPPVAVVQWLRRTVSVRGPVISLVAPTPVARERLAALARLEHPFIATLSADELGPIQ